MKNEPRKYWQGKRGQGKAVAWLREHVTYRGDGCLIFPFHRSQQRGHGRFGYNGKVLYAHGFMCELVNGPRPTPKHQAAHSCGKAHDGCCHPEHLSWKTNSQNQLDRRRHGSQLGQPYGNRGRMTRDQVAKIRSLRGKKTQREIAEMFGVKRGCIEYWHSDRSKIKSSFT